MQKFDFIIIGSGVAGYTASVYASRYKVSNLIIGGMPGGTITEAHKVCNFPGDCNISGMELAQRMQNHAKELGAEQKIDFVDKVNKVKDGDYRFEVVTKKNEKYLAKTVLIATGTKHRYLNLKKEKEFIGKGISYCATCDAMFYKDKIVAVVGGSDAATSAAVLLGEVAKKVYIVYRGEHLRGEKVWIDQVHSHDNIEVICCTNVTEFKGKDKLEKIILDKEYNGSKEMVVDGVFIEIGSLPENKLVEDLGVELDEDGYIKVAQDQVTNIIGVYAAGDITNGSNNFRQVITACSEGAIAANAAYKYLSEKSGK